MAEMTPEQQLAIENARARLKVNSGSGMTPAQMQALENAQARLASMEKPGLRDLNVVPGPGGLMPVPAMDTAKGVAETAATLGTGAFLTPLAGIAGIAQGAASRDDPDALRQMVNRINAVQGLTYQPKTEMGKEIVSTLGVPFEWLARRAQEAGRGAQDIGLGATGGAATETAINMLPSLFGARGIKPALSQRREARRAIGDIERRVAEQGIDINASGSVQRQQIQDAAIRQTGGQQSRGEPFPDIRDTLRQRREAERTRVGEQFEEARATPAALPAEQAKALADRIRSRIAERQFDVETMPIVRRRLRELEQIDRLPTNSAIKLNSIDAYRRRLSRNRASVTDASQNFALDTIKRELDGFLDEAFDKDMIRGDPAALKKWKDARSAFSSYMKRFNDDKVIRKFAEQDATPEQMRQWVFGASSVGARPQAAQVVRKIGDIVGRDSPEFAALRQDALFDIMEPLHIKEPSMREFMKNYDRVVKNNPSLVNELFPDSGRGLRDLRAVAEAVERKAPDARLVDLNRMGAVAMFGHGISRAAMKVNIAQQVFSRMRSAGSKKEKREIMGEVLGIDPDAPILPKRMILYGTVGPSVSGTIERNGQR